MSCPKAPNRTIATWFFVTVAKLPTAIAASLAQFSSGVRHQIK